MPRRTWRARPAAGRWCCCSATAQPTTWTCTMHATWPRTSGAPAPTPHAPASRRPCWTRPPCVICHVRWPIASRRPAEAARALNPPSTRPIRRQASNHSRMPGFPGLPSRRQGSATIPTSVREDLPREAHIASLLEIASRVRGAIYLYALIWVVISQTGHFYERHTTFVLANAAGLFVVGVMRTLLHLKLAVLLRSDFERTARAFRVLTSVHCLHWGLLCAITLQWKEAEALRPYMLLVGVGVAQGGTMMISIDRVLGVAYPMAGLTPVVLAALMNPTRDNLVLATMCVIFGLYVVASARVVSNDYWSGQVARLTSEERARQLEIVSITDSLTQLPNRLFFNQQFAVEWAEARRLAQPLAVAVVDLDHFKRINDRYGHLFGDVCLRAAADALQDELKRPSDLVARYGGEEFVLLLRNTDLEGAVAVANRLAERMRGVELARAGHSVGLSCSIGVCATVPLAEQDPDSLLQRADEALYRAKHLGRDQVVALGDKDRADRGEPALTA
ncbi:MAG: GGDEF domain-containing protein [Aquabacterium sp.]|nr:MAG: GGDEF domain-containing protein [Aquabacterium sp.]